MIIEKVKVKNYKTYLDLDLNLGVKDERSIVLIGGMNGGGKTTLFEAICGALYGLKLNTKDDFNELLNDGGRGREKPEIILEVTFTGQVLGATKSYLLRRTYILNAQGQPVESVMLNMDGNKFVYGTATPARERVDNEQQVNKIIKANLPQELSKYFLFDAMQSSELLKKNVFAQIIQDNIENVMGFKKYVQMSKASERIQQEWGQQRLEAEKEAIEYERLCKERDNLQNQIELCQSEQDQQCRYLADTKELYENAKKGADDAEAQRRTLEEVKGKIADIQRRAAAYSNDLQEFVEGIEFNLFLPKMASDVASEIENVVRQKDALRKNQENNYGEDTIRDITVKVVNYLKDRSLCVPTLDEEALIQYLLSLQHAIEGKDSFAFLDENEVNSLRQLMMVNGMNKFPMIDRMRQDLELQIGNLSTLKAQKSTLEQAQIGGNEDLVREYEDHEKKLKELKDKEEQLKSDKKTLENKIHKYDIQIQQEPDVKYDTLVKMKAFFDEVSSALLKRKKSLIETEMKDQLNKLLISYKDNIDRVELSDSLENFNIKLFHKHGNEISLNQLNAASKQIFIQVLLKVLRNLGDYNPPVMIDTVMGVLDEASRDALMEEYFPQLAEQTILLCTTSEIRKDSDYKHLEPFVARSYTLCRDVEAQCTTVEEGYFGIELNN